MQSVKDQKNEKLSKQVPFMFPINDLQLDIALRHLYRRKAKCRGISGVTVIKLHYIRLLAGPELVLRGAAPANNLTGQRAHIHH